MSGAIPPLPEYASMAWCSVKAQGQLYIYLYSLLCPWYVYKCVIHANIFLTCSAQIDSHSHKEMFSLLVSRYLVELLSDSKRMSDSLV
jgi:hypothetical protein